MNLTKNELYEIAENMEERLGTREFIDALLKQMSDKELYEALKYLDRMYDTNLFE